jgi:hypothetical protein
MTAAKRGKSALSRFLAQRTAERDQPDASATPAETQPAASPPPKAVPASKAKARRRRQIRTTPDAPGVIVTETPVPEPTQASKAVKKANWQDLAGTPIQVVRRSKLDAYVDKIGVMSDAEVARMAGVTQARVYLWRRRRGISSARDAKATPPVAEAPVQVEPVVTPAQPEPFPAPPSTKRKRGRPSKVDLFKDKIGMMSDVDLAALAGVAVATTRAWRLARGTPAARAESVPAPGPGVVAPTRKPRAPKVGKAHKVRKTKMDAFLDRIGVLPDAQIAALAGVTVTNVFGYRQRHGIPAPPRQARVTVVPESVAVQLVGKPEIDTPVGTNVRTVRLTDRVEDMLQALVRVRGIDLDSAISVAIAQDYLRCRALMRDE